MVSSCVQGLFAISGVWIFQLFFAILFFIRALYDFLRGKICYESIGPLVFVISCVRGLFAISSAWIFDFFFAIVFL